eukprot:327865_1
MAIDGLNTHTEYSGPLVELMQRFAFRVRHINHNVLLDKSETKYVMKSGYLAMYQLEIVAETVGRFECQLLRHLVSKLRHTIEYSAECTFSLLLKKVNSSLSSVNYRNSKNPTRKEVMPLPLFLKRVKYAIEIDLNKPWSITGRKPKRTFKYRFTDDEMERWFTGEKTLIRVKVIGKRNGKKTIEFGAYDFVLAYDESKCELSASYNIKRRIDNGKWIKNC